MYWISNLKYTNIEWENTFDFTITPPAIPNELASIVVDGIGALDMSKGPNFVLDFPYGTTELNISVVKNYGDQQVTILNNGVNEPTTITVKSFNPAEADKVYTITPKVADYPVYSEDLAYPKEAEEMNLVFQTITSLRNVRQSFNISTSATVDVEVRAEGREKEIFNAIESYIRRLAKVNNISYAEMDAPVPPKSATAVVSTSKLIVPLADLIDLDAEVKRQEKKLEKLTNEKNSLLGRMKNEKFVANAPKELVDQTNARIEELTVQENVIKDLIVSLK